jgi:hypothetical protein
MVGTSLLFSCSLHETHPVPPPTIPRAPDTFPSKRGVLRRSCRRVDSVSIIPVWPPEVWVTRGEGVEIGSKPDTNVEVPQGLPPQLQRGASLPLHLVPITSTAHIQANG